MYARVDKISTGLICTGAFRNGADTQVKSERERVVTAETRRSHSLLLGSFSRTRLGGKPVAALRNSGKWISKRVFRSGAQNVQVAAVSNADDGDSKQREGQSTARRRGSFRRSLEGARVSSRRSSLAWLICKEAPSELARRLPNVATQPWVLSKSCSNQFWPQGSFSKMASVVGNSGLGQVADRSSFDRRQFGSRRRLGEQVPAC